LRTLFLRWLTVVLGVLLVAWLLPQFGLFDGEPLISFSNPDGTIDWTTLFIFAIVLALLNTFIRPILVLLSAPITCLTLGLFVIVINMLMFWLADWLVPNITTAGWLGVLVGALAVSVVGFLVNFLLGGDR
jgi:putative membrane protein